MNNDGLIRGALTKPHSFDERTDPDFVIAHRCERCGTLGMGPRKHLKEAIQEHLARCPARSNTPEAVTRLFYPRS